MVWPAKFDVHHPIEVGEHAITLRQVHARAEDSGHPPRTASADKDDQKKALVKRCRDMGIRPHVDQIEKRRGRGVEGHTSRPPGYKTSQHFRQHIEERFGWMKLVGGLRPIMHRGSDKVAARGQFIAAACTLVLRNRPALAPPNSA